jgi:RNA polymerase sigma factor (sigma-70 family)
MGTSLTRAGASRIPLSDPSGHAAAVEALSRQFRTPLVRFFEKRIGRQAEIEDLVQEVFLRLASGQLDSVNQPEAYLFKTAVNLLHDRERRRMARASYAHVPYDEAVHGSADTLGPERALLGSQAIEQLVAALYELPERTRTVWVLYHFEDLPHAEIARRLGIAVSTIEKHMGRASTHLLKRLDRST